MAKPRQLDKAQYETLAEFRYALRQFMHPGRDSVTVGELAERLQVRHHSAVGLVDRLVAEKLVSRAPSTKDRRQVFIQLSRRGESVLAKLSSAHSQQLLRIGPGLSRLLKQLARVDA